MKAESWAIVIIVIAMSLSFLRTRLRGYALAVLPLVILPLFHLFSSFAAPKLGRLVGCSPLPLRIGIEGIALAGAAALFIYFSTKMKNRISRIYYLFLCLGFTISLFIVYLLYLIG